MAVNTGFSKAWLVLNIICLLMETLRIATAAQLKVGDDSGWAIGPNYATWAANKELHSGDTLVFKYSNTYHDVLQVTKSDYDSCKSDSSLATYKSGNDIVSLSKPGSYYYLCGFPGHCEAGQKVAVVVLAAAAAPPHSAPSHAPSSSPLAPKKHKSAPSPSPLAPAPKKIKSAPSPSPLAPAPKKHKSAPSPSPAHKSLTSPYPAPESSYSEKAGPSPSKSLNSVTAPSPSSKNSAHKLSVGSALQAVMWASLVLFFSL